ncbi:MAG: sigma 54-interacting transcriptional regulator [Deltaproteobacteria bacterium]|nr:sigma 54-interacting transcriptional regulator [Deltaproteobacteria bacterium]
MFEKELDSYWKTVVDTIQDGVMIVNTDGVIVSVNRAFENITGYIRNEIIGASCSILNCNTCKIARNNKGHHWCLLFQKEKLRKQTCVIKRKDDRYVHVVKNASVLLDAEGNVAGAVETMTDITDLMDKEVQIEKFRRELKAEDRFHGMVGSSAAMQRVFDLITNAARSDAPVIIFGESGTGKELVAKAIHNSGNRKDAAYIKVNCAALNESLLESELFGHVKGAFTGAHKTRKGRFEAAQGGDLFLDEIGDLPLSTQIKLLRVLEEKVVERVGDNRPIHIDTRIISATSRNLSQLVEQGAYREDFYYRINVIPIHVPPLRERFGDIPILADTFFRRMQMKSGKKIEKISKTALESLMQYRWPGNVRELKSAFEYAFVSCNGPTLLPEHFPFDGSRDVNPVELAAEPAQSLDDIKKQRLVDALNRAKGNQSEAARILGISRTSVWSQMKRFNLNGK